MSCTAVPRAPRSKGHTYRRHRLLPEPHRLFRNQWGYRPHKAASETDADFKERIRAVLRDELDKAKVKDLLVPQVAWGYFAAGSDGNDLVVFQDETRTWELARFSFPRQTTSPGCASPIS